MAGSRSSLPETLQVAASSSSSSEFSQLKNEARLLASDKILSYSMSGDSAMLTDVTVPILESGLTPFCSGDNVNQCLSYINQVLIIYNN